MLLRYKCTSGFALARNKKPPRQRRQKVALHKSHGLYGAQCGVRTNRQSKNPESSDSAEAMSLLEGVLMDKIRLFIRF